MAKYAWRARYDYTYAATSLSLLLRGLEKLELDFPAHVDHRNFSVVSTFFDPQTTMYTAVYRYEAKVLL